MMPQLLLHLWGDYILQSQWMADYKRYHWRVATIHAALYSVFFFLIGDWRAVEVIFGTHLLIDRFGLARYIVYAKNHLAPKRRFMLLLGNNRVYDQEARWYPWEVCTKTGYYDHQPDWLIVWLTILVDNALHLTINYCALRWL